jgi:hypothetical protein
MKQNIKRMERRVVYAVIDHYNNDDVVKTFLTEAEAETFLLESDELEEGYYYIQEMLEVISEDSGSPYNLLKDNLSNSLKSLKVRLTDAPIKEWCKWFKDRMDLETEPTGELVLTAYYLYIGYEIGIGNRLTFTTSSETGEIELSTYNSEGIGRFISLLLSSDC